MNLDLKDLSPDEILQDNIEKKTKRELKKDFFWINKNLKIAASKRGLFRNFLKFKLTKKNIEISDLYLEKFEKQTTDLS